MYHCEQSVASGIAYTQFVNSQRRTAAEGTAAILMEAAHSGVPVLIPGAHEVRVARPGAQPAAAESSAILDDPPDQLHGRGRLEHEREGGGAPSQRQRASRGTPLARLRRWLFG